MKIDLRFARLVKDNDPIWDVFSVIGILALVGVGAIIYFLIKLFL